MWFGEPHSFPERESPTKLKASGQQSSKGDRVEYIYKLHAHNPEYHNIN